MRQKTAHLWAPTRQNRRVGGTCRANRTAAACQHGFFLVALTVAILLAGIVIIGVYHMGAF